MDFGILDFHRNASINRKYAMAFKNGITYCVAPLDMADKKLSSYDFWAVGINCCSKTGSSQYDYHCSQEDAHSGLRVARESERSFYQLAVNQAAATHGIAANNPLFFEMVANP